MTDISGRTKLAAVIGNPVRHSLSPLILNEAFRAAGLDWRYVAFEVVDGSAAAALHAMETLGIEGLSVTMPHKAAVAQALGNLTTAAAALGAVNCVFWRDGELWGDSTDGEGFVDAFELAGSAEAAAGSNLDTKVVLLLGTGGAARSVAEAVGRRSNAVLYIAGRNEASVDDAVRLAEGSTGLALDEVCDLTHTDVIINATSVGMAGTGTETTSLVPAEVMGDHQVVVDLIYQPRRTSLLQLAARRGATTINGVPMLIHQAARAFEHWTSTGAPIGAMTKVASDQLEPG